MYLIINFKNKKRKKIHFFFLYTNDDLFTICEKKMSRGFPFLAKWIFCSRLKIESILMSPPSSFIAACKISIHKLKPRHQHPLKLKPSRLAFNRSRDSISAPNDFLPHKKTYDITKKSFLGGNESLITSTPLPRAHSRR